jgi:hypothetical protein
VREDSIPRPSLSDLGIDALDCRDHVTEAAHATRVPDLAGAPLAGDVFADAIDNFRPSALSELGANNSFRFSEAVAEKSYTMEIGNEVSKWNCP